MILLTGEGLGRLLAFAARPGTETAFVAALAGVRKIVRGPKPAARPRAIGQVPDLAAAQPTSAGVIAALAGEDPAGRRVAVQLYPGNPDPDGLLSALARAGAAVEPVLPYAYASEAEDRHVLAAIAEMAAGRVDLIAFASAAQVRRLQAVAEAGGARRRCGRRSRARESPPSVRWSRARWRRPADASRWRRPGAST